MLKKPLANLRRLALVSVSLISYGAAARDAPPEDANDPVTEETDESNPAWDDAVRLLEIISRDEEKEREALQMQLDEGDITQEEFDLASAALDQEIADAVSDIKNQAKHAARDAARDAAKDAARGQVKAAVKNAVKDEVKDIAKNDVKNIAKAAAKGR